MSQFIEMFKNEKMVPLGKFCSIEKGSTITRNEVSPGDIPVVAGGQEPSCYHNVSNREAGMITVSASGAYAGFVNYWTCPIFASDCNTISPKEKNATDTTFLFYGMKALQKHIYGLQKGGAQPHVYGKDLQNLLFPLPTIDKQSSFSIIAQQADKSEFDGFKSQFIEMFEGDKYPHEALDSIAADWLKGQPFRKDEIEESGIHSCIHYGELFTKYGPIISQVQSYTSSEPKRLSKSGDILFPASDVTPNGLARCSMLPFDDVILGGDIIILRPKEGFNSGFLSYAINNQTSQLLTRVNGGVVKHMSSKSLKSVLIPIPPMDKQEEYIGIAHQADKSEFELRKSIDAIDAVIKSLINS